MAKKIKKKRDKKMSAKTMNEHIDLQKTIMVQKYLANIQSKINKIETTGIIPFLSDLYETVFIHKLNKCVELNSETDSAVRCNTLWTIMNDLLHDETLIENVNRLVNTAYNQDDCGHLKYDNVNNTGRLRVGIARTTRRIGFNLLYKNYLMEISYIIDVGVSNSDLDKLTGELWNKSIDGVLVKDYTDLEFKATPISRFGITIKEIDDKQKSSVKQRVVAKHTPISNKTIMVALHDEHTLRVAASKIR